MGLKEENVEWYIEGLDNNFKDSAYDDFVSGWNALVTELEALGYNVDEILEKRIKFIDILE